MVRSGKGAIPRALEYGPDYPEAEQELLTNQEAINAWNERKFAERPAGQTAVQSLAQWQVSCEEIRRLVARMDDVDMERPFFLMIGRGWVTVRDGLRWCCNHDWSEFTQLRIHMRRSDPLPSPEITRSYLGTVLGFFPIFLNQEAAAGREFSTVIAFSDPEVGAWTIRVANGAATLSEGAAPEADLVMRQSAETFEKSLRRIHNPTEAIQSGAIQVSSFDNLAIFGQLFPM